MKTVGIVGGSGYTGGELIRLIINHPKLKRAVVHLKILKMTRLGNL